MAGLPAFDYRSAFSHGERLRQGAHMLQWLGTEQMRRAKISGRLPEMGEALGITHTSVAILLSQSAEVYIRCIYKRLGLDRPKGRDSAHDLKAWFDGLGNTIKDEVHKLFSIYSNHSKYAMGYLAVCHMMQIRPHLPDFDVVLDDIKGNLVGYRYLYEDTTTANATFGTSEFVNALREVCISPLVDPSLEQRMLFDTWRDQLAQNEYPIQKSGEARPVSRLHGLTEVGFIEQTYRTPTWLVPGSFRWPSFHPLAKHATSQVSRKQARYLHLQSI